MSERPCHALELNGERILNLYPKASGVLLTDGDEESSVAIPTALVYDLILALHDYKDGDAVPPTTEARWKEIAQERGDMLDDYSRQLTEARTEVAVLRRQRDRYGFAVGFALGAIRRGAGDEAVVEIEKAIRAVQSIESPATLPGEGGGPADA